MKRLIENGVACSIYSEVDDPAGAREHDRIHADSKRIKGGSHGYPLFRVWYMLPLSISFELTDFKQDYSR